MKHENYIVVEGPISIRSAPKSDKFIDWRVGDTIGPQGKDYPNHFPIEEMLLFGKIIKVEPKSKMIVSDPVEKIQEYVETQEDILVEKTEG